MTDMTSEETLVNPALLRRFAFRDRRRFLAQKVERHQEGWSRARIEKFQVQQFNAIWAYCLAEVPFYRTWRAEHGLPDHIVRPTDLHLFPLLDKVTIVARADEIFQHGAISSAYSTGGSTGRPTRYPRGAEDVTAFYANAYLPRSWWGIEPFDSCALLWGHSHLFGRGVRGYLLQRRRRVADHLLNITRLDAYDLTDVALGRDYDALIRSDPLYLVGYTSAIFQLAKYIQRNSLSIPNGRKLRAVVLTAEAFSAVDAEVVESVFGARVVSEYGTAETSVIAASRDSTTPLLVLWDSFICLVGDGGELALTTLDTRRFPLVNYVTGDRIQRTSSKEENCLEFDAVLGRQQDAVRVTTVDGTALILSGILPIHILKSFPGILAIQYCQRSDSLLEIHVQADHSVELDQLAAFFTAQMQRDHPTFDPRSVRFVQVTEVTKTTAGKQALFVT